MKKLTLIIIILGMITISNAQIEKIEMELTPEMEEMAVAQIKDFLENYCTDCGIKNKEQLENLHLGKPIPNYMIVNEQFEALSASNVFHISEGKSLSLRFMGTWNTPVMFEDVPLLFIVFAFPDSGRPQFVQSVKNKIEHCHNYEHKDLLIGSVSVFHSQGGMDYLIIQREKQDIYVQFYDYAAREFFKNEYTLSEVLSF